MLTPNYTGPWTKGSEFDSALRNVAKDVAHTLEYAYRDTYAHRLYLDGICIATRARTTNQGGFDIQYAGVTEQAVKDYGFHENHARQTAVPGTLVFSLTGSVSTKPPKSRPTLIDHLTEQVLIKLAGKIPAVYANDTRSPRYSERLVMPDETASLLFRRKLAMRAIGAKVVDAIERAFNKERRQWRYGAALRPIGYASVPDGHVAIEQHKDFPHGVAVYDERLHITNAKHWDLVLIPEAEDVDDVVERAALALSSYGQNYLDLVDKQGTKPIEQSIGQVIDKENVHLDRSAIAPLVVARLRELVAGSPSRLYTSKVFNEADTSILHKLTAEGIEAVLAKYGCANKGGSPYTIVSYITKLLDDRHAFKLLMGSSRARTSFVALVKEAFAGTLTKDAIYADPGLVFSPDDRAKMANSLVAYSTEMLYSNQASIWLIKEDGTKLLPFMTPDILAETVIIVGKLQNKDQAFRDRIYRLARMLAPQIAAKNAAEGWV
jgi:phosphoribosyl-ATP pyrophosphohydrolase